MLGAARVETGAVETPRVQVIVGIDTGGTFTDFIAFVNGELRTHKLLSTPHNPAAAVLQGLRDLLPEAGAVSVTYGSTVATNALLERRGARVVLLTTAGFEDVIEIGRQNRPQLYALEPRRPEPLVPRRRRIGVQERILHDGRVLLPLGRQEIQRALRVALRQRYPPEAIAICLLHSYANPAHERAIGRAVGRAIGHAAAAGGTKPFCSLSHQIIAEYREYERFSTTVINAYVGPLMSRHLGLLTQGLRAAPLRGARLRVMQSNGGAISTARAGREAVRTVLSGPAAGVTGAWAVAQSLGLRRVISFDMGGTSTDVSLIDGAVRHRTEWEIAGMPLKVPAIDIHTVGAGGGSLAWVDAGGALKVGPESAGADPGPACYGKGKAPTVTDANVVLGRLAANALLGGRMQLRPERAEEALRRLGRQLKMTGEAAAQGVVRVVNAGMERAIRRISVERGHDPRDYALLAFGGAAGQHACELAAALGIRHVVVPRHPGLLSAWGAARAAVQHDYVRTVGLSLPAQSRSARPKLDRLRRLFEPLLRKAREELRADDVPDAEARILCSIDLRYEGQSYEVNVPLAANFRDAFHTAHARLYGYADRGRCIEVVNLRVAAVGEVAVPREPRFHAEKSSRPGKQRIRWGSRWVMARAVRRDELAVGKRLAGPAVLLEFSAATFIPPGWRASVHRTGHLELTLLRKKGTADERR